MKLYIVVGMFWIFSCANPPAYHLQSPVESRDRDQNLLQKAATTYPLAFKMKHRILLTISGTQTDLTGYMLYRQPGEYYAAAYAEAAAPVFEFVNVGTDKRILRWPQFMPEVILQDGIMVDLAHLYTNHNPIKTQAVARTSQTTTFASPRGAYYTKELQITAAGHTVLSRTGYKDELVRQVRYSNFQNHIPHKIILQNFQTNYRMQIDLLEIKPIDPGELAARIKALR